MLVTEGNVILCCHQETELPWGVPSLPGPPHAHAFPSFLLEYLKRLCLIPSESYWSCHGSSKVRRGRVLQLKWFQVSAGVFSYCLHALQRAELGYLGEIFPLLRALLGALRPGFSLLKWFCFLKALHSWQHRWNPVCRNRYGCRWGDRRASLCPGQVGGKLGAWAAGCGLQAVGSISKERSHGSSYENRISSLLFAESPNSLEVFFKYFLRVNDMLPALGAGEQDPSSFAGKCLCSLQDLARACALSLPFLPFHN